MTSRFVETEREREVFLNFIKSQDLPFTASITEGGKRTARQNRLNRRWMLEIADQLGWTAEYARGYCKLVIGVAILKEDPEFAEKYDRVFRPLDYETKLSLMQEPFDFPVTRLMNTKQQTRYMDEVFRHFAEKGVALSLPIDLQFNHDAASSPASSGGGGEPLSSPSPPSHSKGDA